MINRRIFNMFDSVYKNKKTPYTCLLIAFGISISLIILYILIKCFVNDKMISIIDFVELGAILACLVALVVVYKKDEPRVVDSLIGEILAIITLLNITYAIECLVHYLPLGNLPFMLYVLFAFQWIMTAFCVVICVNHYITHSKKFSKIKIIIYNRLIVNIQLLMITITAILLVICLFSYFDVEVLVSIIASLLSMCVCYAIFMSIVSLEVLEHKELKFSADKQELKKIQIKINKN